MTDENIALRAVGAAQEILEEYLQPDRGLTNA
jgi:hypothetical protein